MKKRYKLSYFIIQAIKSLWRNGVMSFASIAVLMSCLVVMGGFALLVKNINVNLDNLNMMNQIVAFCYPEATEEEIAAVETQINGLDGVEKVVRVTKAEGLQKMKDQAGEYEDLYSDITDENNPLSDSFEITYVSEDDVSNLQYTLSHMEGVRKVNARVDLAKSILKFKNSVQWVFIWFLVILFVVTVFIIINTIKLALHSRRHEISVMRYVGATGWFITLPFIFEGMIIGLVASVIAYFVESLVYGYIERTMLSGLEMLKIIPFGEINLMVFLQFLAVGIITGVIGSLISLGKYLKS
jgi:cell division transport system permease protein